MQGDSHHSFHVTPNTAFTWLDVSLTGNGTTTPEFNPKIWDLGVGTHTFTFYGREANAQLDMVTLVNAACVTELCNGLDDNCNSQIDESWPLLHTNCSVGMGACMATGKYVCSANQTGIECNAVPEMDEPEVCDNDIDEDCDGNLDNGCECVGDQSRVCYGGPTGTAGIGICKAGDQACSQNQWGPCVGQVLPTVEICNDGLDNDCDGLADAADAICYTCYDADGDGHNDAACGGVDCNDANANIHPGVEENCRDKIDNDCNGKTDYADEKACQTKVSGEGCGCASASPYGSLAVLLALFVGLRRRNW